MNGKDGRGVEILTERVFATNSARTMDKNKTEILRVVYAPR